jgi:hypothetical protein
VRGLTTRLQTSLKKEQSQKAIFRAVQNLNREREQDTRRLGDRLLQKSVTPKKAEMEKSNYREYLKGTSLIIQGKLPWSNEMVRSVSYHMKNPALGRNFVANPRERSKM